MNIENIKTVRDAILADMTNKVSFNMSYFGNEGYYPHHTNYKGESDKCGTIACICGWTNLLMDPDLWPVNAADTTGAQEYLGLDFATAHELFLPSIPDDAYSLVTPEQAAKVMNDLIDTGVVNWGQFEFE